MTKIFTKAEHDEMTPWQRRREVREYIEHNPMKVDNSTFCTRFALDGENVDTKNTFIPTGPIVKGSIAAIALGIFPHLGDNCYNPKFYVIDMTQVYYNVIKSLNVSLETLVHVPMQSDPHTSVKQRAELYIKMLNQYIVYGKEITNE